MTSSSGAPSNSLKLTARTVLERHPERGRYDRDTVYQIIDEALICHVAFIVNGRPVVIPTLHARMGDTLYIHGSAAGRMLGTLAAGADVSIAMTIVDGLVLARAAATHSVNYRSVVLFGRAREVTNRDEKLAALSATVDQVVPGRSADARPANDEELAMTGVVALPIDEASAKVRAAGPADEPDDYRLKIWAGVIPVALAAGAPIPDERVDAAVPVPGYASSYRRPSTIV